MKRALRWQASRNGEYDFLDLFGRSLLRSEMQQMGRQMERLMFEEFRGQQELDSGRRKTGSTVIM